MAVYYDADHPYEQQHYNGVHVNCHPAPSKAKVGSGTASRCAHAGTVGRVHSHDYEGPLVCGCDEEVL